MITISSMLLAQGVEPNTGPVPEAANFNVEHDKLDKHNIKLRTYNFNGLGERPKLRTGIYSN